MCNKSKNTGVVNVLKLLLAATIFVFAQQANAASVTYDFNRVEPSNNVEDLSDQLSITIWDAAGANSAFNLTGTDAIANNQLVFTVQNDVGISSSVAEVYFDDGGNGFGGPSVAVNSLGGFTNFSGGSANPENLPGGNNVGFTATTSLSADASGNPDNGVNTSDDILGIILDLGTFTDFNAVVAAVGSGDVRFGLHVRSIGVEGGSDAYVNNPAAVPIPAAVWLLGTAIVGLVGFSRRPSSAS